mgnify:CR=1 FL=1
MSGNKLSIGIVGLPNVGKPGSEISNIVSWRGTPQFEILLPGKSTKKYNNML